MIGTAVGTPGPPVVLYATTQAPARRAIKANLQAFFVVNQVEIVRFRRVVFALLFVSGLALLARG